MFNNRNFIYESNDLQCSIARNSEVDKLIQTIFLSFIVIKKIVVSIKFELSKRKQKFAHFSVANLTQFLKF